MKPPVFPTTMANDVFTNLTSALTQVRNIGLASDWTTDDFRSLTGAPARKTLKIEHLDWLRI